MLKYILVLVALFGLSACAENYEAEYKQAVAAYDTCLQTKGRTSCYAESEIANSRLEAMRAAAVHRATTPVVSPDNSAALLNSGAEMLNASRPQYQQPAYVYVAPPLRAPVCQGTRCW